MAQALVSRILHKYLAKLIKNYEPAKMADWELRDILLDEATVQDLLSIPTALQIQSVSCSRVRVRIPWTRITKDSVVFLLDRVDILLVEPADVAPPKPKPRPPRQSRPRKVSLKEVVLDGFSFEIAEIFVAVHPRGAVSGSIPPFFDLLAQHVSVFPTNRDFEPTTVSNLRKSNKRSPEYVIRRCIRALSMTGHICRGRSRYPIFEQVPMRFHVTQKHSLLTRKAVALRVECLVPDLVSMSLGPLPFAMFSEFVQALAQTMERSSEAAPAPAPSPLRRSGSTAALAGSSTPELVRSASSLALQRTASAGTDAPEPGGQRKPTAWRRFKAVVSRKSNNPRPADSLPAATPSPPPSPGPDDQSLPDDSTIDEEEYDDDLTDDTASIADSEGGESLGDDLGDVDFVAERDDIKSTCYVVDMAQVHLHLLDADGHPFAGCVVRGLKLTVNPATVPTMAPGTSRCFYMEASTALRCESVTITDTRTNPPNVKHPDFVTAFAPADNANGQDVLSIVYINRRPQGVFLQNGRLPYFRRELAVEMAPVRVVVDTEFTYQVYTHVFGDPKSSSNLKTQVEASIERMVESCLYDYIKLRVHARAFQLVLPPFAGHTGPDAIAAQALRCTVGDLSFASCEEQEPPSTASVKGTIFRQQPDQFPAKITDFTVLEPRNAPFCTHIRLRLQQVAVDMLAHPSLGPAAFVPVLDPVDLTMDLVVNDWFDPTSRLPVIMAFAHSSELALHLTTLQYQYLSSVVQHRLAWPPAAVQPRAAVAAAAVSLHGRDADPLRAASPEPDDPVPMLFIMGADRGSLRLVDPDGETIAVVSFAKLEVVTEHHPGCKVIKSCMDDMRIVSPRHRMSPFSSLVTRRSTRDGADPCFFLRMEKPQGAPSNARVLMEGMQISLIVDTLAQIFVFFSVDDDMARSAAAAADQPEADDPEALLIGDSKAAAVQRSVRMVERRIKTAGASASPGSLEWHAQLRDCHFVAVESPDTPECVPMEIELLTAHRSNDPDTKGQVTRADVRSVRFFSYLWMEHGEDFFRRSLCEPFDFTAQYRTMPLSGHSEIQASCERLVLSVSRGQFVLILNSLEHQLEALKNVDLSGASTLPAKADDDDATSRNVKLTVADVSVRLQDEQDLRREHTEPSPGFALMHLTNVRYGMSTKGESQTKKELAIDSISLKDTTAEGSAVFAYIVRSKSPAASSGGAGVGAGGRPSGERPGEQPRSRIKTITDRRRPQPDARYSSFEPSRSVPTEDPRGFFARRSVGGGDVFDERTPSPGPNAAAALTMSWVQTAGSASRIVGDFGPMEVVYKPAAVQSLRQFFTLLGHQQNLRKRYQRLMKDLQEALSEGVLADKRERQAFYSSLYAQRSEDFGGRQLVVDGGDVDTVGGTGGSQAVLFKIIFNEPSFLFPEAESATQTRVNILEVHTAMLMMSNDNIHAADPLVNRTDLFFTGTQVNLDTIVPGSSLRLNSVPVVEPTTLQFAVTSKALDRPHAAYAVSCDNIKASVSIRTYVTSLQILERLMEQTATVLSAQGPASDSDGGSAFEVTVGHIDLAVVSDYVDELELFYFYVKAIRGIVHLAGPASTATCSFRLEVLWNNLNFLSPEPLLDSTHFGLELVKDQDDDTTGLSMTALNPATVHVSQELLRHLSETVLMLQDVEPGAAAHSHFQYIVSNQTECTVRFAQTDTPDVIRLLAGATTTFNFSNPFLPKLIEVTADGLTSDPFPVDVGSVHRLRLGEGVLSRVIVAVVRSQGLKQLIEFLPSYQMVNNTGEALEISVTMADSCTRTVVEGDAPVPIRFEDAWKGAQLSLRFCDAEAWSAPFQLSDVRSSVKRLVISGPDDDRLVFLHSTTNASIKITQLIVSAPLVVDNLCDFAVQFQFAKDEAISGGVLPSKARKSFFFDPKIKDSGLQVGLLGYRHLSRPIPVSSVERHECMITGGTVPAGEYPAKDSVALNAFVVARLSNKVARTIYLNTPFLFVNKTDILLVVRQRGRQEASTIDPQTKVPFSWASVGARQIIVKMAAGAWSKPMNIFLPSINVLEIDIPEIAVRYQLVMEVSVIDSYTRVVTWTPRLRFTNHTRGNLCVIIGLQTLVVPRDATMDSAAFQEHVQVLLYDADADAPDLTAIDVGMLNIVPVAETQNFAFRQYAPDGSTPRTADVNCTVNDQGTYVVFSDNVRPPYVVQNQTDRAMLLVQQQGSGNDVSYVEAQSSCPFFWTNMAAPKRLMARLLPSDVRREDLQASMRDSASPSVCSDTPVVVVNPDNQAMEEIPTHAVTLDDIVEDSLWTDPFAIDQLGVFDVPCPLRTLVHSAESADAYEDFFSDDQDSVMDGRLYGTVVSRGPSKLVLIGTSAQRAPDDGAGEDRAEETGDAVSLSVRLRVPRVLVRLLRESHQEVGFGVLNEVRLHYSKAAHRARVYLTVYDLQVDNALPDPEYSVILSCDRRQLYELDANFVELLHERVHTADYDITEYVGVRLLPLNLWLDGQFVGAVRELLSPLQAEGPQTKALSTAVPAALGTLPTLQASNVAARKQVPGVTDEQRAKLAKQYVEELCVFQLDVNLCIGDNEFGWPVIRDGIPLSLADFRRSGLFDAPVFLVKDLGRTYLWLGSAEVYSIIGSMDAIGSPLGGIRRVVLGLSNFVSIPWTGLVYDDTPGAFLVGFVYGTGSLLMNVSAAFLLTSYKLMRSFSSVMLFLSFDQEYQARKKLRRRKHPESALAGLSQGTGEFVRSCASAVAGIGVQIVRETRKSGPQGVVVGLGKGIIGLPVKVLGGVADLFYKTLEGIKATVAVGYVPRPQMEATKRMERLDPASLYRIQSWVYSKGEALVGYGFVRVFTRRGRLRDRLLVFSTTFLHLFKYEIIGSQFSLPDDHYPTSIPLDVVASIEAPVSPPSLVVVALKRPVKGRESFSFLVPNRSELLAQMGSRGQT